jgi:hypothetical protein
MKMKVELKAEVIVEQLGISLEAFDIWKRKEIKGLIDHNGERFGMALHSSTTNYASGTRKVQGSTTNQQMQRKRQESKREKESLTVYKMDTNGNFVKNEQWVGGVDATIE